MKKWAKKKKGEGWFREKEKKIKEDKKTQRLYFETVPKRTLHHHVFLGPVFVAKCRFREKHGDREVVQFMMYEHFETTNSENKEWF